MEERKLPFDQGYIYIYCYTYIQYTQGLYQESLQFLHSSLTNGKFRASACVVCGPLPLFPPPPPPPRVLNVPLAVHYSGIFNLMLEGDNYLGRCYELMSFLSIPGTWPRWTHHGSNATETRSQPPTQSGACDFNSRMKPT